MIALVLAIDVTVIATEIVIVIVAARVIVTMIVTVTVIVVVVAADRAVATAIDHAATRIVTPIVAADAHAHDRAPTPVLVRHARRMYSVTCPTLIPVLFVMPHLVVRVAAVAAAPLVTVHARAIVPSHPK